MVSFAEALESVSLDANLKHVELIKKHFQENNHPEILRPVIREASFKISYDQAINELALQKLMMAADKLVLCAKEDNGSFFYQLPLELIFSILKLKMHLPFPESYEFSDHIQRICPQQPALTDETKTKHKECQIL